MKCVCKECGSENIQVMVWINPNTEQVEDFEVGVLYPVYCNDCEEHSKTFDEV